MRWRGRAGSGNIEDRRGRGMGMALPVGGGIGGLVLLLLFVALTGQVPFDTVAPGPDTTSGTTGVPADDQQAEFVSVVLADTEETWSALFKAAGSTYPPPTLVLFTDATQSACGVGQSAMGPFYCPNDRKVYLDLSFFHDLETRFGAPGDFAQAYVVAHEVGHHIQMVTGTMERVANAAPVPERPRGERAVGAGRSCRRTATRACGDTMPRGAGCSNRAMRKKGCAPPRRSATIGCSGRPRGAWPRNRSRTERPSNASDGCGVVSTTAASRRAIRSRAARSSCSLRGLAGSHALRG